MDLNYFCTQIDDELHGAKDYIERAIEIKPMSAEWSKNFVQMAEAEKEHALRLYTMLNDYFGKLQSGYRETPAVMSATVESTRKHFDEGMEKYAVLYSAYQKL